MVRWQLFAMLSAVAAGVTAVFAKAGLQDVPSNLGNAVRTGIVLLFSLLVLFVSGEHQKAGAVPTRAWIFLALSATATAVSWIAYFKALSLGPTTPVSAIDKASLVVTLVLSAMFLHERISLRVAVGVLLIIAGTLLASWRPGK